MQARVVKAGALCLLAAMCATGCVYRGGLASGVTPEGVLSVRQNMTYDQVVRLIGGPLRIDQELGDGHDGRYVFVRTAPTHDPWHGKVLLTYSRRRPWAWSYPMLWVHLENGRVQYVYAKLYVVTDGEGIYESSVNSEHPWNRLGGRDRTEALKEFHKAFGDEH